MVDYQKKIRQFVEEKGIAGEDPDFDYFTALSDILQLNRQEVKVKYYEYCYGKNLEDK